MPFRVERGRETLRDLKLIHDFLFDSHVQFSDSLRERSVGPIRDSKLSAQPCMGLAKRPIKARVAIR